MHRESAKSRKAATAGRRKRQENTIRARLRLNPYDIAYPDIGNLRYPDIATDITLYDVCTWPLVFAGTSILGAFIEATTSTNTEICRNFVFEEEESAERLASGDESVYREITTECLKKNLRHDFLFFVQCRDSIFVFECVSLCTRLVSRSFRIYQRVCV